MASASFQILGDKAVAHVLVLGNRLIDQIGHIVPSLAIVGDIGEERRGKGDLGSAGSGVKTKSINGIDSPQVERDEDAGLAAELPADRSFVGPEAGVAGLPELAIEEIGFIAPGTQAIVGLQRKRRALAQGQVRSRQRLYHCISARGCRRGHAQGDDAARFLPASHPIAPSRARRGTMAH